MENEGGVQLKSTREIPLLTSSVPVTRSRRQRPGSVELTAPQAEALSFARNFLKANGFSVSRGDLKKGLKLSSDGNAHRYLKRIERRGWLKVAKGIDRGVRLTREGAPLYEPEDFRTTTTTQVRGRDESAREPEWIDSEQLWRLFGTIPDLCLRIRGDAMERSGLSDGGIVALSLLSDAPVGDGDVVAARVGGDVVLRRYHRINDRTAELRAESRSRRHATIRCVAESEDVEILGVVIGRMLAGGG